MVAGGGPWPGNGRWPCPTRPGSPSSNAWPARPCHARHATGCDQVHSAPFTAEQYEGTRLVFRIGPRSSSGSAFPIESGSDFAIGIKCAKTREKQKGFRTWGSSSHGESRWIERPIRLPASGSSDASAFPSLNRGERRRIQARSSLATTDRILIDCFMADRLTLRFMMAVKHPHLDSGP